MKELIHKIRQILMGTRVIENKLKYQSLCCGCSLIHFIFAILMFVGEVNYLSIINMVATLIYIFLAFVLAPREMYKTLFLVALIEVEVNAALSSFMLGEGYEFMIYTLSLIPGAFYLAHTWPEESNSKYGISPIPSIATLVVGIMYIVVEFLYTIFDPVFDGEKILRLKPVFHYFNILIAVFLILAFSILFALEVRYIQKLLNDENSRLGEIASRDPLTKAYNRRSMYEIINHEVENNEQLKLGLIILDIDDFKKVNDTYGHVVGDQVLTRVANVMQENLRECDYFCRWGGEEFLIAVHGNKEDYMTVAERIRKNISVQVFDTDKIKFSVTATMGISEYQTGVKLRTIIDMADQKLYYGKKHGKNQVVT